MTHQDHGELIKNGISKTGGAWAELGSGTGAFTLALREILGSESEIYSIDKDKLSLDMQRMRFDDTFPDSRIHYVVTDFTQPLKLPTLDGMVMANSLHFIKEKIPLLLQLKTYLKPKGTVIIVENNSDVGNQWVPYPTSEKTLKALLVEAGYKNPQVLHCIRSEFLGEIFGMKADSTPCLITI
jgi:ubiquinone/menaquinone biosynthesis C-methylase UbiE